MRRKIENKKTQDAETNKVMERFRLDEKKNKNRKKNETKHAVGHEHPA